MISKFEHNSSSRQHLMKRFARDVEIIYFFQINNLYLNILITNAKHHNNLRHAVMHQLHSCIAFKLFCPREQTVQCHVECLKKPILPKDYLLSSLCAKIASVKYQSA